MSRYFDDELTHSGVKGMKWRKHKYKSAVKDANGNLKYFYYHDLFNTAPVTGVGGKFDGSQQYYLGPNPNHTTRFSNSRAFIEKDSPVVKKRLENDRRSDALNEKKNASANRLSKPKQDPHARQERRINEARAKRAEKKDKEAEQKKREIKAHHVANNHKAKATGKRAKWAYDKPYQSRVEYDQEDQRHMLKERDYLKKHGGYHQFGRFVISGNKSASQLHDENYKDEKRWRAREMEGFYDNRANIGQRSRAAESTARHKAAVKAQKKKRFTDTIDKGRKAVEEFFTPKKKKKR